MKRLCVFLLLCLCLYFSCKRKGEVPPVVIPAPEPTPQPVIKFLPFPAKDMQLAIDPHGHSANALGIYVFNEECGSAAFALLIKGG